MNTKTDRYPAFSKTIPLGKNPEGETVRVDIHWDDRNGRLSITGETRYRGREAGAGQCIDALTGCKGGALTPAQVERLQSEWRTWHLNDMQAACEHQRERGETWTTHPSAECPDCGYRLGSAWLFMEVPRDVVEWLDRLPTSIG
jgi:hypothetical protein